MTTNNNDHDEDKSNDDGDEGGHRHVLPNTALNEKKAGRAL